MEKRNRIDLPRAAFRIIGGLFIASGASIAALHFFGPKIRGAGPERPTILVFGLILAATGVGIVSANPRPPDAPNMYDPAGPAGTAM